MQKLQISQSLRINLRMQVGAETETLNVEGNAAAIELMFSVRFATSGARGEESEREVSGANEGRNRVTLFIQI